MEVAEPEERTGEPERCQESACRRTSQQSSAQKPGYRRGIATAIALTGGGVFLRTHDGRELFMPGHYCNRGGGGVRFYDGGRHLNESLWGTSAACPSDRHASRSLEPGVASQ